MRNKHITDTEMLNWLEVQRQRNPSPYGKGWVARKSDYGRGFRVHETSKLGAFSTVREAIVDAMANDKDYMKDEFKR